MKQETSEPRLVADVGGTNVRIGLVVPGSDAPIEIQVLACRDFPSLDSALEAYLAETGLGRPRHAAIAVATPVKGDQVSLTNHTWTFSIEASRRRLSLERLLVINDFTALALSIPHLDEGSLRQVGGTIGQPRAPKAVIGPGTGLGVSGLVWAGQHWVPLEGEGGHVCYGGANAREAEIVGVLRERYGNVSAERLISGPGLCNLHWAVCRLASVVPEELAPAEIAERALRGSCERSMEVLRVFCGALGTVAGDLALTLGAFGGVYIGGGVVPKLGDYFLESDFRRRFEDHGRMRGLLEQMPCFVIHAAEPALLGVARAFDLGGSQFRGSG